MQLTRKIAAGMVGILLTTILLGCSNKTADVKEVETGSGTTDTAIVMAIHANMPMINMDTIAQELKDTCMYGGNVSVIRCDGNPTLIDTLSFEKVSVLGSNKKESICADNINTVIKQAANCVAVEEGNDPLRAVALAANTLQNSESECSKKLIIYDTFLSTCNPVDLSSFDGSLSVLDIDSTIETLESSKELPNLTGIDIVCLMSPTANPQEELNGEEISVVQSLWSGIFEKAGASSVNFRTVTVTSTEPLSDSISDLPSVNTIKTSGNSSALSSITLTQKQIEFRDNSSVLVNEIAARKSIQEAVDKLKNSSESILICGTTASDGDNYEGCLTLSKDRAEVVHQIMIDCGFPESRITAIKGFGCSGPYFTPDIDANQNQIESIAEGNRTVTLEPSSTKLGKEILSGKYD